MSEPAAATSLRLAYLTSVYPRATDTFIRAEVDGLRALGFAVDTFSLRRPPGDQLVSDALHRETASTTYLLTARELARAVPALARRIAREPRRVAATIRRLWAARPPGPSGFVRSVAWLLEGARLADELTRRDVAHLHNHMGDAPASVAMVAATLSGVPWSTTIHGMELLRADEIGLGEKIADAVFTACISHYTRSRCMLHVAEEYWPRLEVVRCGIGRRFLDATPAPLPEAPRLLCVGRLSREKGVGLLVAAATDLSLRGHEFELVLLGDGPERAAIERAIEHAHLQRSVTLTGWVDSDRVAKEIEAATALVVPSLSEGIPVAMMEAMALGRPVVTTRVGGIPELVVHERSGWLVDPGSVRALADGLEALLSTPAERLAEMGALGAARVRERHDVNTQIERLAELFRAKAHAPQNG